MDESGGMIPAKIICGGTTYVHFADGDSDYYTIEDSSYREALKTSNGSSSKLMQLLDPVNVYKYCVAKNHNNTVYFSNKSTIQSVWVLPDLSSNEVNEEDCTMIPEGWVSRAVTTTPTSVIADVEEKTSVRNRVKARLEKQRKKEESNDEDNNLSSTTDLNTSRLKRSLSQTTVSDNILTAGGVSPLTSDEFSPHSVANGSISFSRECGSDDDNHSSSCQISPSDERIEVARISKMSRLEAIRQRKASSTYSNIVAADADNNDTQIHVSTVPVTATTGTDRALSAKERLALYRQKKTRGGLSTSSVVEKDSEGFNSNDTCQANSRLHPTSSSIVADKGVVCENTFDVSQMESCTKGSDPNFHHESDQSQLRSQHTQHTSVTDKQHDAAIHQRYLEEILQQKNEDLLRREELSLEKRHLIMEVQNSEAEELARVTKRRREMEEMRISKLENEKEDFKGHLTFSKVCNDSSGPYSAQLLREMSTVLEKEREEYRKCQEDSQKQADVAKARVLAYADTLSAELLKSIEEQRATSAKQKETEAEMAHENSLKYASGNLSSRAFTSNEELDYFSENPQNVETNKGGQTSRTGSLAQKVGRNNKEHVPQELLTADGRVSIKYPNFNTKNLLINYNHNFKYLGDLTVTVQEYHSNLLLQKKHHSEVVRELCGDNTEKSHFSLGGSSLPSRGGRSEASGTNNRISNHPRSSVLYQKEGRGLYYYNAHGEGVDTSDCMPANDEECGSGNFTGPDDPIPHPNAISFYNGMWKADRPHGDAPNNTISAPNSAYQGTFYQGDIHGRGTLQTKQMYGVLDVSKGKASGPAVLETNSSETYAGLVNQNKLTSPGSLQLAPVKRASQSPHGDQRPNRDQMEWVWGSAAIPGTGKARIRYANGDLYVGDVVEYVPHGEGSFVFKNGGHEYIGSFNRGTITGKGVYRFSNGNLFDGEVKDGHFHGKGRYTRNGEYQYDGHWSEGKMHGTAVVTFSNGDVWEGVFVRDVKGSGRYIKSGQFILAPPD